MASSSKNTVDETDNTRNDKDTVPHESDGSDDETGLDDDLLEGYPNADVTLQELEDDATGMKKPWQLGNGYLMFTNDASNKRACRCVLFPLQIFAHTHLIAPFPPYRRQNGKRTSSNWEVHPVGKTWLQHMLLSLSAKLNFDVEIRKTNRLPRRWRYEAVDTYHNCWSIQGKPLDYSVYRNEGDNSERYKEVHFILSCI